MEDVAAVLAAYVQDDKDLCTLGLSCKWMHSIAQDEMSRRHPEAAAGVAHYAFKLAYPPFVEAAAAKSKMPRRTFELLAECLGPVVAGRIAMKRRSQCDLYAMNAFAVIVRRPRAAFARDGSLFHWPDEEVLGRIASFVLN